MKFIAIVILACATFACSDKKEDKGPAETTKPQKPAATETPPAKQPAPPPRDPRLVELFTAGQDCTWDKHGWTKCETAKKVEKLAFNKQSDRALAESCAGALQDPQASTRGLAASCLKSFNEVTQAPHFGALLDAFEAEKEAPLRLVMACAASRSNARRGKVEDRVIPLVRKVAAQPDSDRMAACLLSSMFPAYLMASADKPSKAAGDVALEFAQKSGQLQQRALEALGQMSDRAPEVCGVLATVAAGDQWPAAVQSMAKLGDACSAQIDPIVATMAKAMTENRYKTGHYSATRALLRKIPLTDKQVATLKKASKKLAGSAKGVWVKNAKELAASLKDYKPPAAK